MSALPRKLTLADGFRGIQAFWSPHIAGRVNDTAIKLVKLSGAFDWHHHEREDELFLVIAGAMTMRFRDGAIDMGPGDMVIVPRGLEHQPFAEQECHVLLVEPINTLNTGNLINERTRTDLPDVAT